jgi:hypothetical protein
MIREIRAANRALAHYDGVLHADPNPEILHSPLTTQEAALTSRIEGTRATFRCHRWRWPMPSQEKTDPTSRLDQLDIIRDKLLAPRPFRIGIVPALWTRR